MKATTEAQAPARAMLVSEPHAAHLLGVAPGTLKAARLRRLPDNPLRALPYLRIGRAIRYRFSDIEAWVESNVVGGVES